MITICYFAALRETLGTARERIALPEDIVTVVGLRDHLAARGDVWSAVQSTKNLRIAVNLALASLNAVIEDGDEVAFFPPVTGG